MLCWIILPKYVENVGKAASDAEQSEHICNKRLYLSGVGQCTVVASAVSE